MIGIPEWSIGVGLIVLCVAAGQILVRLFIPEGARRNLKSRLVDPTGHAQVLEDVQARLGELDQLKRRMSELEERVDFAERLLSQQREGQRLGPPHEERGPG